MARVHGSDLTAVNIDDASGSAVDYKAETLAINWGVSVETHDTTTIGDQWHEFTSGLKGGDDLSHECMYNNTNTTGIWVIMAARLGIEKTFGFTDGTRTISMETIITNLSIPITVGDMIKFTATHQITGAVTFS